MSMKSMTGFGTAKAETKTLSIEVSVRAVNGRFLENRMHIPREYISIETELKKTIAEKFQRGTIDVFISRKAIKTSESKKVSVNVNLLKEYQKAFEKISKELKVKSTLDINRVAMMPDVLLVDEIQEVQSEETKLLKKIFMQACIACEKERLREGKSLRGHMLGMLDDLEKNVIKIENLREVANKQLQEKTEIKIKQKLQGGEVDSYRLTQEIAYLLDKADVNEELQRLKTHFENYKKLINGASTEGKKLDFYTQELLREINTIGSKSQVSEITEAVVDAKTVIERLREQVQNVE